MAVAKRQPTDIVPTFRRTPEESLREIFVELDHLCFCLIRFVRMRNIWPFRAARQQVIALLGVSPKMFRKIIKPQKKGVKK